eukprot:COSAG03_NODE_2252_length_2957_cov_3.832750_3_plen_111_part_00
MIGDGVSSRKMPMVARLLAVVWTSAVDASRAPVPPPLPTAFNLTLPFAYMQSSFVTGHALGVPCRTSSGEPVCLPACLPACLSVCLSVCLPVWLSACLPACLPACLSVCL